MIGIRKKELKRNQKLTMSKNYTNNFLDTGDLNLIGSKKIVENKKNDDIVYLVNNNISRFDNYHASIHFKSTFLIIANITFFGFLLTSFEKIDTVTFSVHIFLMLISLLFALLTTKQYFKRYKGKNSLLLFNDIVNMENNIFIDKIDSLSKVNYIRDLKKQNIILAYSLISKSNCINKSIIFMILNIVLFMI